MSGRISSSSGRRRVMAVVASVAAALLGAGVAGSASAHELGAFGQVTKNLTYSCTFPLVGPQDVTGKVAITLPDSGTAGQRIAPGDLNISVTLQDNIVGALRAFGTAYAQGTGAADVDANYDGKQLTLGIPGLNIARADIPPSGPLTTTISGPMPNLVVYKAGTITLRAGQQFNAKVDTRKADGTPTPLGILDVPCTIKTTDPPQDTLFANIPVSGPSTAESVVRPLGDVNKNLTYTCTFPQIGNQQIQGNVKATIPDTVAVGQRAQISNLVIGAQFNPATANLLRSNQAATVEGRAYADVDATLDTTRITIGIPGSIPQTPVPPTDPASGSITPDVPSLIFYQAGTLDVAAGQQLNGTVTPRKSDGTATALGTFALPCTVDPGQDQHIATVPITA
ncbi:DUF6801 domain-containing protein [Amycolatopsis sp. NPDC059027]|uniref:DUF6801 domain-containing protein n=1 Tax=Amycolatopsis sp. NPDC059027 TaxID=3346709 RepID=UPI00366EABB5